MEGCIQNLKIHTEDAKLKFSRYSGLPHSVIHITHFFLSRCGLGKGMIPHSASLGIPTVRFTCNPEFFCRVFEGSCPPNKPKAFVNQMVIYWWKLHKKSWIGVRGRALSVVTLAFFPQGSVTASYTFPEGVTTRAVTFSKNEIWTNFECP